jgi:hypothetical protein
VKKPGALLKVAAVASSLVLVGGFIACSAGAFDWLMNTMAPGRTYMGGSKSKVLVTVPGTAQPETPTADPPATSPPSTRSE